MTVLANEQVKFININTIYFFSKVDSQGKSWRSGAVVEKKLMKQWFLKITNYAEVKKIISTY